MAMLGSSLVCAGCTTVSPFEGAHALDATYVVAPAWEATGHVGTAFALRDGTYVTAAHVINGIIGSRYEKPFLYLPPDEYAIAAIVRYSQEEDFVVFTVTPRPSLERGELPKREHAKLSVSTEPPAIGQAVHLVAHDRGSNTGFSVVDAQTEALTGDEAEYSNRHWFAFRSRAAAGMSGGALIDARNDVVGLVSEQVGRPKSPADETHNLATRMTVVMERQRDVAIVRAQNVVRALDLFEPEQEQFLGDVPPTVFAPSLFEPLDATAGVIPLSKPMPYAQFMKNVVMARDAYFDRTLGRWLQDSGRKVHIATAAAPACELLNGGACTAGNAAAQDVVLNAELPQIASRSGATPITFATQLDGALVLHRVTATPVTVDSLFPAAPSANSPSGLALHTDTRWRDKLMISDLEDAARDETYKDLHGRAWHLRTWPIKQRDLQLIALARPVSDGYVALFRLVPTSLGYAATLHLKILANIDSVAATGGT
jgi:hypothetical protein